MFKIYVVPPDGTHNIARYTFPFALGQKQKQHRELLNEILRQTKALIEKEQLKYCSDSKKLSMSILKE
jgi:hypothetical protein